MSKKVVQVYNRPAGGWGALKSVAQQIFEQGIPGKGARTLLSANQPDGFDCPGCAWPDADHTSTFEFCENGAKAVAAESTARRATADFIAGFTVAQLSEQSDHWLEAQGRLTQPLQYDRQSDSYQVISWPAAFELMAMHLHALPSPHDAIFYTSGRTSNEAAFLYQLFVREFGTNNFPDCSNMCHEPSGLAMRSAIGTGKGTVLLDDFQKTDAIFIFGQNPGTNHPRMLGELRAASKRGAAIVAFNPLRERGLEKFQNPQDLSEMLGGRATAISSQYMQLKIGGDLAAVKGIIKAVLEADLLAQAKGTPRLLDLDFIAEHTAHFEVFAADVLAEPWSVICTEAGLERSEIEMAAQTYLRAGSVIACWGMGITQHKHSVATIQMIINLLLLRGNIGRPGAGVCPVRGHSNVQGDRTMGINEQPSAAFLARLGEVFDFTPPQQAGFDTVAAIHAMLAAPNKVFFAMGGNFASATPDTELTHRALRQCALTVHVTTKLNRSHLVCGREALILPCLGRTEIDIQASGPQSVTVEDSMSMVHLSAGINAPASPHLLSETMIVARLAHAVLQGRSKTDWLALAADYDLIRDKIAAVFDDFADFNARVKVPGGFHLRNRAAERIWQTDNGKASFHAHAVPTDLPIHQARRTHSGPVFNLATMRSHDQYNTTIYGLNDRYRGVFGERRVVFINQLDIDALGRTAGDWIDLESVADDGVRRQVQRFMLVAYPIPRGCLAAYFPETNGLVALDSYADGARTPTSKSIPVLITPHLPKASIPAD
ncbi:MULTISPECIES: FdhF/YdeP family oxidoreductase [unclassified Undibacterium]|uniref:FdhF/YdeP family oxidoreductase n=1 Tax=unclassified Undibacterium TaxID=2630295 RepID=UPI002AC98E9B|nr:MULTISPECIES: FdhF/YdeP family oxidoreductase [unclassified Undibacterium]MEB0138296.1 FdhF/YdeP family oxidoreductase [Undibacterium sp. CCC2.1]MEB0170782.1 FdhF/YdeP family oxidoreductase [Undibacterium sp. CCC1.1]MEB0174671.1 FdhF/YdeP family oxidoreductase [Undibacterium sp. CCC3.4]MEB0213868.1 FdhF/YdeP family oxidoreductase [Undibacterium sp. 5I2]WPX42594.1 FdhF/YdeP family oxidoreductase [Undibacterium sp. CCC3.4]